MARLVPAPRGLDHLRAMSLAGRDIHGAVGELHARYGPVFAFGVGPLRFTWLVGAEAARFVTQEAAPHLLLGPAYRFLRPIGGSAALITSDEPAHLRRRRLVQPAFHKARLEDAFENAQRRFEGFFERLAGHSADQPVDLYAALRPHVLTTICEVLLGEATLEREPDLVSSVARMMDFTTLPFAWQEVKVPLPGSPWARFVRARRRADAVLYREIRRRRATGGGEGVMSLLLAAEDETGRGLSDEEVRDQALSLVSAGFDTTSAALTWAVYALLSHPELLARLRAELRPPPEVQRLPLLERVVKETLRLYPPAPAALRVAGRDLEFQGHTLPKGQRLALSIYATHRSRDLYPDPLRFNPERWERPPPPFGYLPFGSGTRYCIGAGLATGLIKLGLATLLRRFEVTPMWEEPVQEVGNTVHPKGGLPVRLRLSA